MLSLFLFGGGGKLVAFTAELDVRSPHFDNFTSTQQKEDELKFIDEEDETTATDDLRKE